MLRNMEYVYEVYKQGSFTKAAKSLYVSQPCLSALVKKTEEKLGFRGRTLVGVFGRCFCRSPFRRCSYGSFLGSMEYNFPSGWF